MANKIIVSAIPEIENDEKCAWIKNVEGFFQKLMMETDVTNWEVSVFFCDDEKMKELNSQYRNIDDTTDVLSFESDSSYIDDEGNEIDVAGDIVISIPALMRNAEYFSVNADDELKRLLTHGFLHLSGQDHGEYHIGKEGCILDENQKVPVYSQLTDEKKAECDMLVFQESLLEKLSSIKIITN